jgi:hypothetical protein
MREEALLPSHIWCDTCQKIQPTQLEPPDALDLGGKYLGGDLLCAECRRIIATFYTPRS